MWRSLGEKVYEGNRIKNWRQSAVAQLRKFHLTELILSGTRTPSNFNNNKHKENVSVDTK